MHAMYPTDLMGPPVLPVPVSATPVPCSAARRPDLCLIELLRNHGGEVQAGPDWVDFRFLEIDEALAQALAIDTATGRPTATVSQQTTLATLGEQAMPAFRRVLDSGLPERLTCHCEASGRRFQLYVSPLPAAHPELAQLRLLVEEQSARTSATAKESNAANESSAATTAKSANTANIANAAREAVLAAVLDTTQLHQGLLASDGRLVFANAASLSAIGASLDEVIGRPVWETAWFSESPGTPERIRSAIARVAQSGNGEHTVLVLSLGGAVRTFDFNLRPVVDTEGRVEAVLFESVETTARFKAEQALVQAQKLEAIGRLTGGIAHDFNNLLMAVLGSLELLRKRCSGQLESLKLITNAMRAVDRGTSLTRRMLAFARRQDLKTEPVEIASLVRDMQDLIQRSIGPMITVETRCTRKLPAVETDVNQLESALLNLVINARDAVAGQGRILISGDEARLTSHDSLAPGHYVTLSVTDDGSGMSRETLEQAIEPFFTTKGVGQGTGLGLSMVLGLAEQCGGTLTLDSHEGLGTTATIWLPALTERPPTIETHDASAGHELQAAARPAAQANRLRVLAVDDDELILAGTVAMLEDLGHHVATASSAALALDLIDRHDFDLLLTDHAMPGMSGLQLADMIRAREPDLPIVLMTGFADLPPEEVSVGGVELPRLAKPFWQADLAAAVSVASRRRPLGSNGQFSLRGS